MPPALTIALTAYDEEETLAPVIEELLEVLGDAIDFEVVVVDDGSTDRTAEIGDELAAAHSRVRCVHHLENRGKSAAVVTAVRAARAPWILTMDADGQNEPRDFARLWEAARADEGSTPLLVCGQRARRADTLVKHLSSRIANGVRRRLLRDATPDTGCGIKLFPRQAFLDLPHFHNMHRFLPALFLRQGGRVRSLLVQDRERQGGVSKFGLGNRLGPGILDLFGVMWLTRRPAGPFSGRAEPPPDATAVPPS